MAGKISTLVLKVDLDCHLCYKKIRKVLCKLQEKEDVKAIFYDDKTKTVTISGPFDPDKVSNWLCCRACKIIKEIEIKDNKPKDAKPAEGTKPKEDKPKTDKPKDDKAQNSKSKNEKPKNNKAQNEKSKDEKTKEEKGKNGKQNAENTKEDSPKNKEPAPVESDPKPKLIPQKAQMVPRNNEFGIVGGYPQISYPPGWPTGSMGLAGPAGPACCFRPIYEVYYGGWRCCTCGSVFGYGVTAPMGFYGGAAPYDAYKGSQYFSEESSSCRIM